MNHIPDLDGRHVASVLEKAGWMVKSQRGSHLKLVNEANRHFLIVPIHGHASIPRGTLINIIRDSGISSERFAAMV